MMQFRVSITLGCHRTLVNRKTYLYGVVVKVGDDSVTKTIDTDEVRTSQVIAASTTRAELADKPAVRLENVDGRGFIIDDKDLARIIGSHPFRTYKRYRIAFFKKFLMELGIVILTQ